MEYQWNLNTSNVNVNRDNYGERLLPADDLNTSNVNVNLITEDRTEKVKLTFKYI